MKTVVFGSILMITGLAIGCGRTQAPAKDAPAPAAGEAAAQDKKETANNDNQVRDLLGQLVIRTTRDTHLDSDRCFYLDGRIVAHNPSASAYWFRSLGHEWTVTEGDVAVPVVPFPPIRIAEKRNGQLIVPGLGYKLGPRLETDRILLVPGEYRLEACLAVRFLTSSGIPTNSSPWGVPTPEFVADGADLFPFVFRSTTVKVEAGKVVPGDLNANACLKEYPQRHMSELWRDKSNRAAERVREMEAFIKRTAQAYHDDPVKKAMFAVLGSLAQAQLSRPAVHIDLPKEYGGGREFDAVQVKQLIDWLRLKYWDPCREHYDFVQRTALMPGETPTPRSLDVPGIISQHEKLNEQLNEIVKKLRQARK